MSHPRIITENLLDEWIRGHAREAQGITVELVWRVVSASCPSPLHRRFPLGDSIGQHGPDGELETVVGDAPFVPDGKSFWEIGAGLDARAKANSDYNDLTAIIPLAVRQSSCFLFVTPLSGRRDWKNSWKEDGVASWVDDRRNRHDWLNVHVLNGTSLIDWLYRFPAVERWLAGVMGQKIDFIETLDSRWETLRMIGNPPSLSHHLFTTNRQAAEQKTREIVIDRSTNQLKLDTKFPTQGADFVSALASSFDEEHRVEAIGRCLIVSQEEAWAGVCNLNHSHVLIADFDLETEKGTKLVQAAINKRHAVIYCGMPGGIPHGNRAHLPVPDESHIKEALERSQYPPERARLLSKKCDSDLNALLRCLQGLSAMPEWAQTTGSADIAVAMALGGWKDGKNGDRSTIEAVSGKAYGEWISKIREITISTATPLQFRNGGWKMTSRYESWRFLGRFLFDEHVERFKNAAVSMLREKDPSFELEPEERYLASVRGKEFTHSRRLRKGIAETLALMGSDPEALTACTDGYVQGMATVAVREILNKSDWDLWASLNDVLPLLAEAAPYSFLDAVDEAINFDDGVFTQVFAQERSGITGGTFITGILWGLETLAWSPEYFVQVCRVLADFAAIDPGGNWVNRPSNTLKAILLPWFPQTCAPTEKRHAAVRVIIKEQPEVAWKLILTLLPEMHSASSETHKPIWRRFIPEDWKNGAPHEWEDIVAYAEMAIKMAGNNIKRLIVLTERYFRLPLPIRSRLREKLVSDEVIGLSETERLPLWMAISTLVSNHRKYSDHENWKVPQVALEELDAIIVRLAPLAPEIRYQQLFTGRDFNLYEETGDYDTQRKKLETRRLNAIREIATTGGTSGLFSFASSVEESWQVGLMYGRLSDLARDSEILPSLLETELKPLFQLAGGYVWGRFNTGSWNWVDAVQTEKWSSQAKGQFFALLPFCEETWTRVKSCLGDQEEQYWKKASANPFETGPGIAMALAKLIDFGRADAAIHCIHQMQKKAELDPGLVIRALRALNSEHRIDVYAIGELITLLQDNPATDEVALCQLERAFLPLLGEHRHGQPKALSRLLAEQPDFFCELIQTIFRSKKSENKEDEKIQVSDEEKERARSLYHLLREWRIPPGTKRDGSFDDVALDAWIRDVKAKCLESGHWEVAATQVGEILFYAPREQSGLWIDPVCEVLDAADAVEMRNGLSTEVFNSRGTFWFTAGKAELNLAAEWDAKASIAEDKGYSRLAPAFKQLANSYRRDAEREAKNNPRELS